MTKCPHCEYDSRFPGFEGGGWMQQDNNGPIVSCPMCNPHAVHPRSEPGCGDPSCKDTEGAYGKGPNVDPICAVISTNGKTQL